METDDVDLLKLMAHLTGRHGIPRTQMLKEPIILLSKWDYGLRKVCWDLEKSELSGMVPHKPDIVVRDAHGHAAFFIELDGSIHHTKPGAKKTAKRNADYKLANIPFIVIDVGDLKILGVSWFDHLDEEMKKMPRVVRELPEADIEWRTAPPK